MKNKKLIATVASLCLVLVAVVAAVIGVLAAATQNATSKIKVHYTATNVAATVSVNSRDEYSAFPVSEQDSTKFYAGDESRDGTATDDTLEVSQITLAWRSATEQANAGKLNRFAVYRFTFKNESKNNAMSVSLTYTAPSAQGTNSNVTLFWFAGTTAAPTFTASYSSENKTTLAATNGVTTNDSNTTAKNVSSSKIEMLNSVGTNNGLGYVFLVVAISDLEINADYDLIASGNGGQILFTLDAIAAPSGD